MIKLLIVYRLLFTDDLNQVFLTLAEPLIKS